ALAHYNLGNALRALDQLAEAEVAYRKAVDLQPDHAEALCNLGLLLRRLGRFREGRDALRRGHELGSKRPGWSSPSEKWLREVERYLELEPRLAAFLRGDAKPADAAQAVDLAQLCYYKRCFSASARFFADAFALKPALAEDLSASYRYDAACSAAQAAGGLG